MFIVDKIFNENVYEFVHANDHLMFLIKEKHDFKSYITLYNHIDKEILDKDFWLNLSFLNQIGSFFTANVYGERKALLFNMHSNSVSEFDFMIKESSKEHLIVSVFENNFPFTALYHFEQKKIIKKLDFKSSKSFIGDNYFYCIEKVENKNAFINAYSIISGKEKWVYKIESINKNQKISFISEYGDLIFIYNKFYKKVIALNIDTGKPIKQEWKFDKCPLFYDKNKIGCLGYYHMELNLETLEFSEFDMKAEYDKHIEEKCQTVPGYYHTIEENYLVQPPIIQTINYEG